MAQRVALPYHLSPSKLPPASNVPSINHHQYVGPINDGVQASQENLSPNVPLSVAPTKQAELLERLRQLRAWQQRQQAVLLRQQQEQLLKLRNEQREVSPALRDVTHQRNTVDVRHAEMTSSVGEEGEGSYGYDGHISPSPSPTLVGGTLPYTASTEQVELTDDFVSEDEAISSPRFDGEEDVREAVHVALSDPESEETYGDSNLSSLPPSSHTTSSPSHKTVEERPVQPVVGDFEHYLEQQIKIDKFTSPQSASTDAKADPSKPKRFSFLRRGEGIARFGMKKIKLKPKKSSRKQSTQPHLPAAKKGPKSRSSKKRPPTGSADLGRDKLALGPPSVQTYQDDQQPRVRKVARGGGGEGVYGNEPSAIKSLHLSYPRMSTPAMSSCGSEDSFIVRRDDRLKREEEELLEFELLEMATAGDTPGPTFSSSPRSSSSPEQAPSTLKLAHSNPHQDDLHNYDMDSDLKLLPYQHPTTTTHKTNEPPQQEDAPGFMSNLQCQHHQRGVALKEDCGGSQDDLDETLTAPSLVAEVDFNDEEEWNSFSQGSPITRQINGAHFDDGGGSGAPDGSMLSVEVGASWSPPIKREQLNEQGLPLFQSPLPAATLSSALKHSVPSTRHELSSNSTSIASHQHISETIASISAPITTDPKPSASLSSIPQSSTNPQAQKPSYTHNQQLPPPSALVAKLFPALRKERGPLEIPVKSGLPKSGGQLASPHTNDIPSPTSSAGGDSGKGSLGVGSTATSLMNEELRSKLCLLETEIERFKSENAALEKLRKEKEEGLTHLKKEIAEFKRQKEAEAARFEEYKREEMRKLKKERKMFETYQQQARSARDKKDKEDILILRNELQDLQEDLHQRESRWGAAQSRLRLRIQSLEKENQELRNDLKMMEQTRLQLWQKQMEQEMAETKRKKKKERGFAKSITPEIPDEQQESDGYQSDGEGSDLSARAEEIADLVLAADEPSDIKKTRSRTPSGELKDHCPPAPISRAVSAGDEGSVKQRTAINKRVCFSTSPTKTKQRPLASPSKNGIRSIKQQRASPKKKHRVPLSPVKNRERQRAKQEVADSHREGLTESSEEDGSRVILFPNGTRKVISPDGKTTSVYFFNGDVKHTKPNKTVVYFYAETQTTHTTHSDGLEVFEFPNGQCEKQFPNGTKEIAFPDKTLKYIHPSGEEETHFSDGTVQKLLPGGDMTLFYANGQKEIYTKEFKRREYPDGTVKTVYPDGRQETRYASGRVRVKDKEGRTLFDKLPDS